MFKLIDMLNMLELFAHGKHLTSINMFNEFEYVGRCASPRTKNVQNGSNDQIALNIQNVCRPPADPSPPQEATNIFNMFKLFKMTTGSAQFLKTMFGYCAWPRTNMFKMCAAPLPTPLKRPLTGPI